MELNGLEGNELLGFFINIYNALQIQILVLYGPPKSEIQAKEYQNCSYLINKQKYTLSDLYHAFFLSKKSNLKFKKKEDPKFKLFSSLKFDPRVHFALITHSIYSPQIRVFHHKFLDDQLHWATQSYCQDHVSIKNLNNIQTVRFLLPSLFPFPSLPLLFSFLLSFLSSLPFPFPLPLSSLPSLSFLFSFLFSFLLSFLSSLPFPCLFPFPSFPPSPSFSPFSLLLSLVPSFSLASFLPSPLLLSQLFENTVIYFYFPSLQILSFLPLPVSISCSPWIFFENSSWIRSFHLFFSDRKWPFLLSSSFPGLLTPIRVLQIAFHQGRLLFPLPFPFPLASSFRSPFRFLFFYYSSFAHNGYHISFPIPSFLTNLIE